MLMAMFVSAELSTCPTSFFGDDRYRAIGFIGDADDFPVYFGRVRGNAAINFPVKILHDFWATLLPPHFRRRDFTAVLQDQRIRQVRKRIRPGLVVIGVKRGVGVHAIPTNGHDLSFVTGKVKDKAGLTAPRADIRIHFDIEGPGEIVATDNGDPTSFESFQSHDRKAFNGLCLLIVRGIAGQPETIKLAAKADGLKIGTASIQTTLKTN